MTAAYPLEKQSKSDSIQQISPALSRLTWDEALAVKPMFREMKRNSENELLCALAENAPKAVALALQGADIALKQGSLLVKFPDGARSMKGVTLMIDRSRREIPILVRGGKTFKNARVVSGGVGLVSSAAAAGAAVVIVSHIISGADNAKKLKAANEKLDFLIIARRLDQCAKLEAVFRQAKELTYLPDSPATRLEIHRLCLTLHELRAAWRNEALHKLGEIDPKEPEAATNYFARPVRAMRAQANGKRAAIDASRILAELHLLNVSLGLHLALAQASGTTEAFLSQSLPEELSATRKLKREVNQLKKRISPKQKQAYDHLTEVEKAFDGTLRTFRPMAITDISTIAA